MISFLLCRLQKTTEGVQSVCPVPDYTRYIVVPLPVGLANMLGLCLIWSNAMNIRSISSCLMLTGLMYTTLFTCPQRKKSRGVRSGDLVGRATDPHSISISPYRLCLDVLVLAYWSALERHHVGTILLCVSQGVSPPWAAEACSGGIPGKLPHSKGLEWWQVPADNLQEFHPRCLRWISPGEHCVQILVVPDVAVEVAISCEAGLHQ